MAKPTDACGIESLIIPEFERFLLPDYTKKGEEVFRNYIMSSAIADRIAEGNIALVAEQKGAMIGYIEVDRLAHLSLLFVNSNLHFNGVARHLFQTIVPICCQRTGRQVMTVNASRYARGAYEKLGFVAKGDERLKDGILASPMAMQIGRTNDRREVSCCRLATD